MTISRRHFLQAALSTSALYGIDFTGNWSCVAAQQRLSQEDLVGSSKFGNVTIVHVTDIHAQTQPIWYREPEINLGLEEVRGKPPHLTGANFREYYGITKGSELDYALTFDDFNALAKSYGKMGGLDRISTILKSIRSDRPDTIFLDGGDTWQGSLPALRSKGADMVKLFNYLGVDAMTSHWEFTLGIGRVTEIIEKELHCPFLGANIFDAEWNEPSYEPYKLFERGGTQVAVIGQAFPYLPIANPDWLFPGLSFGIRQERLNEVVTEVRRKGAELVVLLSHNGFDVDRKLATEVSGLDVILTGHTHDALPEPVMVNNTFLVASGSHGKFVSRIDVDVRDGGMQELKHRLIPVFSDVIEPDPEVSNLIAETRALYVEELSEIIGSTDSLLYRRGNFNGTWDDLICSALIDEFDANIALSPGFRWGASLIPSLEITREDLFNVTAMSYPNTYRTEMTGEQLHTILEDVADNLFNPDPYFQQGGDMVRVGGLGYRIDVAKSQGNRISNMILLSTGESIEAGKSYIVAGWASVNEHTNGSPIWDVVEKFIRRQGTVKLDLNNNIEVIYN